MPNRKLLTSLCLSTCRGESDAHLDYKCQHAVTAWTMGRVLQESTKHVCKQGNERAQPVSATPEYFKTQAGMVPRSAQKMAKKRNIGRTTGCGVLVIDLFRSPSSSPLKVTPGTPGCMDRG